MSTTRPEVEVTAEEMFANYARRFFFVLDGSPLYRYLSRCLAGVGCLAVAGRVAVTPHMLAALREGLEENHRLAVEEYDRLREEVVRHTTPLRPKALGVEAESVSAAIIAAAGKLLGGPGKPGRISHDNPSLAALTKAAWDVADELRPIAYRESADTATATFEDDRVALDEDAADTAAPPWTESDLRKQCEQIPRKLIGHMWGHRTDTVENAKREVWGKEPSEVSDGSLSNAKGKANEFLRSVDDWHIEISKSGDDILMTAEDRRPVPGGR